MHLLATIEYDGTEFNGFQSQRGGRTVQGELERALGEFSGGRVRVVGGGRTDAGVHALGQTASFELEWAHDLGTLTRAINAKLPRDIAVRELRETPPGFSARYDATSRKYRYTVLNTPVRSPLRERYAFWVSTPLDVDTMQRASRSLVGRHDLGAFGTPPKGANTVRRIFQAEVKRRGEFVEFEFEADAFLYRMVRRLVGTLLRVGSGRMTEGEFGLVLAKKHPAGQAVPAHGLVLVSIQYNWV